MGIAHVRERHGAGTVRRELGFARARHGSRITTLLLLGGVVGPIVFVVADLVQATTRPHYDPILQFVSVLSLGDGGWVQAGNFTASGLLIGGFGIGLLRISDDPSRRLIGWLVVLSGFAFAFSGLFSTDPQWGYPMWIPAEVAANPSWHSRLHFLGGFLAAGALPAAIVVEARRLLQSGSRRRALFALASVGAMVGCFLVGLAVGGPLAHFAWGGFLQRITIVAGFQWLVVFALEQLALVTAHPGEASPA
jgi:hypothetical protein